MRQLGVVLVFRFSHFQLVSVLIRSGALGSIRQRKRGLSSLLFSSYNYSLLFLPFLDVDHLNARLSGRDVILLHHRLLLHG